jgi:hypothetical protein
MNHQTSNPAREDYLYSLAVQACVYAWPLFEMHRMRSATSARKAQGQGFAGDRPESLQRWCNLFTHERALLTAGKSRVVMPNNDTLYANAWLDLSQQPLVISMPDTGSRYYVLGFLDYYTNPFAHLGTRTTGNRARSVLVSGPGWSGEVPEAFQAEGCHVRSSTDWVWIIGRILVDGVPDVPEVNALQDQFSMQTLSDWRAGRPSPARRFDARFEARAPLTGSRFRAMVNDARPIAHLPPPTPCWWPSSNRWDWVSVPRRPASVPTPSQTMPWSARWPPYKRCFKDQRPPFLGPRTTPTSWHGAPRGACPPTWAKALATSCCAGHLLLARV